MSRSHVAAPLVAAAIAFALYHATLLPGLDFGDTASLQTTVSSPIITPRDGYPVYFAIGGVVARLTGAEPAYALNLASAIEGALACALLALVASELSGSALAGLGSALLFAGSYTFWSQSVIAEVYPLHILFVALTLWLLLRWERRPTRIRLAMFFAACALGVGNHLSMILLAPGYVVFMLLSAPHGWRSLVAPRLWLLALASAAAGAAPYAWNLRTLWLGPFPPDGLGDALGAFWFDLTKSDWRATLVLGVPPSMLPDRAAMYAFDLLQQFGLPGPALAVLGLVRTWSQSGRRAALVMAVYLANALFAYTYNVGDTHVFYLPSHVIVAVLAAPGAVLAAEIAARVQALVAPRACRPSTWLGTTLSLPWGRRAHAGPRPRATPPLTVIVAAALVLNAYAALRIYRDYPALDRSNDRRPIELLGALTAGLDDRRAILLTDLDWQIHNGLTYFAREIRPAVAWAHMPDVLLYAPALVRDNTAVGRNVALTAGARAVLAAAYGPLIRTVPDPRVPVPGIGDLVRELAPGTRYVLCVLKPTREFSLDWKDLESAVAALSDGRLTAVPRGDYVAIAGLAGERPVHIEAAPAPFRRSIELAGLPVSVRMESWLATDTIRRMGFGQVVASRHHALIVERGISFVAFDGMGEPLRSGYASSIFAPQPRYLCYR